MKNKKYTLCQPILTNIVYENKDLERLFHHKDIEQKVSISVTVSKINADGNDFITHIITDVIDMGLHMRLTFGVLSKVTSSELSDSEAQKILEAEVPELAFDRIRKVVKSLSSASGFPPIDMNRDDIEIEILEPENCEETPMGYEWLIYDIRSTAEGTEFLRALIEACGESWLKYEESPLYKYYYRFLNPIKYDHPHFDECGNDYWDFLFQLIFAECDSVGIEETKKGLPDIIFSYEDHEKMRTSNLTMEQVKEITSDLGTNAFTKTMVDLYGVAINKEYGDTLPNNLLLLEREIKKLYNYDPEKENNEEEELFKRVCTNVKRYADLTFQYHLLEN